MKKRYVIISIFLLIVVVVSVIAFKVIADLNRESTIKNEIKEISKVFTIANIDDDEVNEILERRVISKGDYAEIENSIKLYYKGLYGDLKNLTFLLDADNFSNYLSSKNIDDDGPDFLKSRSNLANSKAQIEEYYEKIIKSLTSESYKLNYINKDTKKYYVDFYLEITDIAISDNFEELLKNEYDNVLNNIKVYGEAYDFLNANKGSYEVVNNELKFDDATILDQYSQILDKLNKIKKEQESEK